MLTHMDYGSNFMLVTSLSLLRNVKQTKNKIGNTRRGEDKPTYIEYLHMLLENGNKQMLLIMNKACVMPLKNRNVFGLSPLFMHGHKIFSHAT